MSIDFDITNNIKLIEMLKAQLLSNVADLYGGLANPSEQKNEQGDILADIIIITYMLANRLGVSYGNIDMKALRRLKLAALDENEDMHEDICLLLRHIQKGE